MNSKIPFKTKLRFMKWALIAGIITAAEMILVSAICMFLVPCPYGLYVLAANIIVGLPIGMYFIIKVMAGYKGRCIEYLRIRDMHTRYPNKPLSKMLLLQMDASLCEREVARQLRYDFPSE